MALLNLKMESRKEAVRAGRELHLQNACNALGFNTFDFLPMTFY